MISKSRSFVLAVVVAAVIVLTGAVDPAPQGAPPGWQEGAELDTLVTTEGNFNHSSIAKLDGAWVEIAKGGRRYWVNTDNVVYYRLAAE